MEHVESSGYDKGDGRIWRCEMVGVESTAVSRRAFLGAAASWGGREVLRRTPPGRLAGSVPQSPRTESEIIDGLRTYGHRDPLDQSQANQWVDELNADPLPRFYPEIYGTELVYPVDYDPGNIPAHTKYNSYQAFTLAHYQTMQQTLRDDIPAYNWSVIPRRLAVFEPGVEICASWHEGWLHSGILDSNGAMGIWRPTPYQPWTEAYWHRGEEIDYGLLHEAFHRVLHGPDIYCLMWDWGRSVEGGSGGGIGGWPVEIVDGVLAESDGFLRRIGVSRRDLLRRRRSALSTRRTASRSNSLPPPLDDLPEEWLFYSLWDRNDDRGRGLMSVRKDQGLSSYTSWLIRRRVIQRWLHNGRLTIPEASWRYPYEVADSTIFVLGSDFNGARVEVWRSEGNDSERTGLSRVFDGEVRGGEVTIGDPFETVDFDDGLVPVAQGLLLLKVYSGGKGFCRWVDIGDLSTGIDPRTYHPRFRGTLRMRMDLGDSETPPRELDWEIDYDYTPAEIHHVYAPLGLRNFGP